MANPDRKIGSKEVQPKPEVTASSLGIVIFARFIQLYDGLLQRARSEGQGRVAPRLLMVTLATLLAFAPDSDSKVFASISEGDKIEGTTPTPEPTETTKPTPTATRTPEATATPEAPAAPERETVVYTSDMVFQKMFDEFLVKVEKVIRDKYPTVADELIVKALEMIRNSSAMDVMKEKASKNVDGALGEVLKAKIFEDEEGRFDGIAVSLNQAPILPIPIPIPVLTLNADKDGWDIGTGTEFVKLEIPVLPLDRAPTLLEITDEQIEGWLDVNDDLAAATRNVDWNKYGFTLKTHELLLTETILENPKGLRDLKGAKLTVGISIIVTPKNYPLSQLDRRVFVVRLDIPLTTDGKSVAFDEDAVIIKVQGAEENSAATETPTAIATKRAPSLKPTVTPTLESTETPDATSTPTGTNGPKKGAGIKIELATSTPSN
jgi:hypothetical protein